MDELGYAENGLFKRLYRRWLIAKCWIWNAHLKISWSHVMDFFYARGWLKENEFRADLDSDLAATLMMNDARREAYSADLIRRRKAAHERTLN